MRFGTLRVTPAVTLGVVNVITCLISVSEEEELVLMATLVTVHWDCIEVEPQWMEALSRLGLLLVQSQIP